MNSARQEAYRKKYAGELKGLMTALVRFKWWRKKLPVDEPDLGNDNSTGEEMYWIGRMSDPR
jgi:hypothetical protein